MSDARRDPWIRMRTELHLDSRVIEIASTLAEESTLNEWLLTEELRNGMDSVVTCVTLRGVTAVTVALLLRAWGYANERGEGVGESVLVRNSDRDSLDQFVGIEGFADAMIRVGWLEVDETNNSITFCEFRRWNNPVSDYRKANADRQARFRERRKHGADRTVTVTRDVTSQVTLRNGDQRPETRDVSQCVTANAVTRSSEAQLENGHVPGTTRKMPPDARGCPQDDSGSRSTRKGSKTQGRAVSASLAQIYEAYPRRVGRAKAIDAIRKAVERLSKSHNGAAPGAWLLERVHVYAASPAGKQGTYTPYPATWFNQERYFDDPTEWQRDGRSAPAGSRDSAAERRRAAAEREYPEPDGDIPLVGDQPGKPGG